jgi:hypothetical protein
MKDKRTYRKTRHRRGYVVFVSFVLFASKKNHLIKTIFFTSAYSIVNWSLITDN